MKKKILIITTTLLLLLTYFPTSLKAANNGVITISGTTKTNCGELIYTQVYVNSNDLDNISGTITYDQSQLVIYQVNVSAYFNSWKIEPDISKVGKITFSGKSENTPISGDNLLMTIIFIVHGSQATNTTIKATDVKTTYKETVTKTTTIVTNQAEIDAAVQNGEEPPAPITETIEEEVEETLTYNFTDAAQPVRIEKKLSDDSYLRSLSIENATFEPAFSKAVNAYKVTMSQEETIKLNYELEDPKASVVVADEANNQISIVVTAEDGSCNTYILTINRQANYDSQNVDINNPSNPSTNLPTTNTPTSDSLITPIQIMLGALFVVISLMGIVIGARLINFGSHNQ